MRDTRKEPFRELYFGRDIDREKHVVKGYYALSASSHGGPLHATMIDDRRTILRACHGRFGSSQSLAQRRVGLIGFLCGKAKKKASVRGGTVAENHQRASAPLDNCHETIVESYLD